MKQTRFDMSALALSVLGLACSGATHDVPEATRVDSAGVTLIDHFGEPDWPRWTLGIEPVLEIAASGQGYDLFDVRAVRSLASGRLAVLNAGTQQVLVFGEGGSLIRAFGGPGEGPGEFLRPSFLGSVRDSLLVADASNGRVTVFGPDGDVGRTFHLETPPSPPPFSFPFGVSDREIFAVQGEVPLGTSTEMGQLFTPVRVLVYGMDGGLRAAWHSPGATEFFVAEVRGRRVAVSPPLGVQTFLDVSEGRIVMARSDRYSVYTLRPDGGVGRVLRREMPVTPLRPSDLEEVAAHWVAAAPSDRAAEARRDLFPMLVMPEEAPALGGLVVDDVGDYWIEVGLSPGDDLWHVYSGDRSGAVVRLDAEMDIEEIGEDYVIGVRTAPTGEQRVLKYELIRAR